MRLTDRLEGDFLKHRSFHQILTTYVLFFTGYLFNVGKAATVAATETVKKTAIQVKETVEEKVDLDLTKLHQILETLQEIIEASCCNLSSCVK